MGYNGANAKKTDKENATKQSKSKNPAVPIPVPVAIDLKLSEWGCGAELSFSEPLDIDKEKAQKFCLIALLNGLPDLDEENQKKTTDSNNQTAKRSLDEVS